jgi:hypothetical protein
MERVNQYRWSSNWMIWLAIVLLMAGAGSLLIGFRGGDHALPAPVPSVAAEKAAHSITPARPMMIPLSTLRSIPVRLAIPALGMSVPMSILGLNADGSVQVPSGTTQPGWFGLGPAPGQVGSSVVLGHVDSDAGEGIFFELRTLAAGDRVYVTLADGLTPVFAVNSVAMYAKDQFPAQRVYGSHGSSSLQLVTCGGVFDHQTGSYLSNVVVYSSLIAVIP